MRRWFYRLVTLTLALMAVCSATIWVLLVYPRRVPHPALRLAQGVLAIEHARIYVSPDEPPIEDGTVLIRDGLIAAVGKGIQVPSNAAVLPCDHCVVTAGFWNVHVHLTEPKWSMAEWKHASELDAQLAGMFTSRGFTTVADLGSNLSDTLAIRRRIETGEVNGPFIYTAGAALYPPQGIPYYLRDTLPRWIQWMMPQPDSPQAARQIVRINLRAGADLTKLFTGSWVAHGKVLPMPLAIAGAATETTHLNGKLAFAHPSNQAGTQVAIDSGVDVLAHAPDDTAGVDAAMLKKMVHNNMAMSPTLKMFATTVTTKAAYLDPIYAEVRQFHALGGTLLFGTDVGYMTDYSTDGEFEALGKCGLTTMEVLAMLTTNPAGKMGASGQKGTVSAGKLADLTVLDADPEARLTNFARVKMTIRSGKVIYRRP